MSYEVFIDVEHHPKHADHAEKHEDWCVKFADLPEGTDPLVYVVNALRSMADEVDPRVRCNHCGEIRGDHFKEGGLERCFNRLGPITRADWWEDEDALLRAAEHLADEAEAALGRPEPPSGPLQDAVKAFRDAFGSQIHVPPGATSEQETA